jgi:predicted SAM-dependent methyltransferase
MIYFYTAVYGDHIQLQEFDTKGVEFRCYTNRKLESKTWKINHQPLDSSWSPRMQAKWWKLFPARAGDISIWIDASIRVTDVHAMIQACKTALKNHDVALFRHPERDNIYDEARAALAMPNKYANLPLLEQVEAYRAEGLPADAGLWAGGVIARRHPHKNFEDDWWEENKKWSPQDQLSLPYVLWKNNVVPGVIPGSVYKSAFHTWHPTPDPQEPHVTIITNGDLAHPKFSIVTPTHNPVFILDCWKSLQAQTYTNFEWIVSANHESSRREAVSGLAELVRRTVGDDPRIRVIEDLSPFNYVGAHKQFAFGAATGDILVEYDHDDILVPTALEELVTVFKDPSIGFACSDFCDFVEGDSTFQGTQTYRAPDVRPGWESVGFTFYDQRIEGVRAGKYECVRVPAPTALSVSHIGTAPNHVRAWRRGVYTMLGGHNPKYRICDDHELLVRTFLITKMKRVEKPLYLQRITGWNTWLQNINEINTTSNALRAEYLERLVLRECKLLDVPAIELGGGIDPREGWTACDLQDAPIIADLRKRWPFEDGSVGAFRASDLLEHLPDKMHTMSEIHRCLRPGGWLLSMTPSAEGIGAFMDPTHVSYWVAPSFWYYTRPTSARYIRNMTMLFREVHLQTVQINVQGVDVPYVQADLVKL